MKKKVYIPLIIGAGAAAGIILGVVNFGSRSDVSYENSTDIAQETTSSETTLSEEEKKKLEEQKEKEYEEKERQEEKNVSDRLKAKEEEKKKKKEEEEKKRAEEKRKEEEKKNKDKDNDKDGRREDADGQGPEYSDLYDDEGNEDDDTDIYTYLPNDKKTEQGSSNSGGGNTSQATQHRHSWEAVYRTVHHDAQTHNEKRTVGNREITECTYNGSLFFVFLTEYEDSSFYQVCKLANGNLIFETSREYDKKNLNYFKNMMHISPDDTAYDFSTRTEEILKDVTVTDQAAYDEKVFDHYVCKTCGQKSY